MTSMRPRSLWLVIVCSLLTTSYSLVPSTCLLSSCASKPAERSVAKLHSSPFMRHPIFLSPVSAVAEAIEDVKEERESESMLPLNGQENVLKSVRQLFTASSTVLFVSPSVNLSLVSLSPTFKLLLYTHCFLCIIAYRLPSLQLILVL